MHCALIDDDPTFLRGMTLALGSGARCLAIDCADRAIEDLADFQGQVVFVDIHMGAVSGFSLVDQIRAKYPWLKIVMTSAYFDKENLFKAVRTKVDEILEKPFALSEFVAVYEKLNVRSGIDLDPDHFTVSCRDQTVALTKTEFAILEKLFRNAESRITKMDLQKKIWGDTVVARNTLDTHLTNIRRKAPWLRECLQSVSDGYVFTREVPDHFLQIAAKR